MSGYSPLPPSCSFLNTGSWSAGSSPPDHPSNLGALLYPPADLYYRDLQGRLLQVAVVDNWPFFGLKVRAG